MIQGIILLVAASLGVLYWLPFAAIACFLYIVYMGECERWDGITLLVNVGMVLMFIEFVGRMM